MKNLLSSALSRFRTRYWLRRILRTMLAFLPLALAAFLAYGVYGAAFYIDWAISAGIAGSLLALAIVFGLLELRSLWKSHRDLTAFALRIEQRDKKLRGNLSNASDFHRHPLIAGQSKKLAALAIEKGNQSAGQVLWEEHLPSGIPGKRTWISALILATGIGVTAISLPPARSAMLSLLWPRVLIATYEPFRVVPQNPRVIKGNPLSLGVSNSAGKAFRVQLQGSFLPTPPFIRNESADSASIHFAQVDDPFQFRLRGIRRSSRDYSVEVVHPPEVEAFSITVLPPRYARLRPRKLAENTGDARILRGSRFRLSLRASKPLQSASVLFSDSTHAPLRFSGDSVWGTWRPKTNGYAIRLLCMDSLPNSSPIRYRVDLLPDEPPSVRIVEPAGNIKLDPSLSIDLKAVARDDFGLGNTYLHYRVCRSDEIVPQDSMLLRRHTKPSPMDTIAYHWEAEQTRLYPGDTLQFWVKTWDNDLFDGPKSGTSDTLRARFPTSREIFEETQRKEADLVAGLEETRNAQQDLAQKTERLRRRFGKKPKTASATDKSRIRELAKGQRNLSAEVDSLSQVLKRRFEEDFANEEYRNNVAKKMEEVKNRLEKIGARKLNDLFKKWAEKPDRINLHRLRDLLNKTVQDQKDILKELERTLEALRRIQAQNWVRNAALQLARLAKRQDSLACRTANNESLQELSRRQRQLAQEFDSLSAEMNRARRKAFLSREARKSVDRIRKLLEGEKTGENLRSAGKHLRAGNCKSAQPHQGAAARSMEKAGSQMMALWANMKSKGRQKTIQALRELSQNLLIASFSQESLAVSMVRSQSSNQSIITAFIDRALSLVLELGNTASYHDVSLLKSLGIARRASESARTQLALSQWDRARPHQYRTMEELAKSGRRVGSQANRMGSAKPGGASGMDLLGQMLSLSAEQMALNQWVRKLLQGSMRRPGRSMGKAKRNRAGSSQGQILEKYRKILEKINKSSDWAAPKTDVRKEMREVIRDMESGRMDARTLKKQNRILSRMLQGTTSMAERDFSKKRRAEFEKQTAISPSPSPFGKQSGGMISEKDIDYASYPREYHHLIRRYLLKSR